MPAKESSGRPHRRKRQRKSRTEVVSDPSSSESEDNEMEIDHTAETGLNESLNEDDIEAAPQSGSAADDDDGDDEDDYANAAGSREEHSILKPGARSAMNILPSLDSSDIAELRNYYHTILREDFFKEIQDLEASIQGDAEAMRVMSEAVSAGMNIFDEKEKNQLLQAQRKSQQMP